MTLPVVGTMETLQLNSLFLYGRLGVFGLVTVPSQVMAKHGLFTQTRVFSLYSSLVKICPREAAWPLFQLRIIENYLISTHFLRG